MNSYQRNQLPFNFVCLITFQKADGNASGFHKYPRADDIQTRSNPHKSRISLPAWTKLDELSNPNAIRKLSSTNPSKNSPSSQNSNQSPQQANPKSTDLYHGRFCNSDDMLCNRWYGNLWPEGNIRPNPFNFLQLTKFLKLKFWNMTPYAYFWTSGVRHPFDASFQPKIFLSWPTNSWKPHRFDLLWSK